MFVVQCTILQLQDLLVECRKVSLIHRSSCVGTFPTFRGVYFSYKFHPSIFIFCKGHQLMHCGVGGDIGLKDHIWPKYTERKPFPKSPFNLSSAKSQFDFSKRAMENKDVRNMSNCHTKIYFSSYNTPHFTTTRTQAISLGYNLQVPWHNNNSQAFLWSPPHAEDAVFLDLRPSYNQRVNVIDVGRFRQLTLCGS